MSEAGEAARLATPGRAGIRFQIHRDGTRHTLVQDLHPSDRGPKGIRQGAIIANGNPYCPAAPRPLLELGPLARDATPQQVSAHDIQTPSWRVAEAAAR